MVFYLIDKETYDIIGECENQKRIYKATVGLLNNLINASTQHTENFFNILWDEGYYFTKEQIEEDRYEIVLRKYEISKGYIYNALEYTERRFIWIKYSPEEKKESEKEKINKEVKKGLVVKNKKTLNT